MIVLKATWLCLKAMLRIICNAVFSVVPFKPFFNQGWTIYLYVSCGFFANIICRFIHCHVWYPLISLWYPLISLDIPWYPFDIPWYPFDIPWYPLISLWYTFDIPWYPLISLWYPFDIPWYPLISLEKDEKEEMCFTWILRMLSNERHKQDGYCTYSRGIHLNKIN